MNINTFKQFVEFVSNKVQQGNTVTVPQFNLTAHRAQMQLFENDYEVFLNTEKGEISDFLSFFLRKKSLIIDSIGESPYPSDYEHTSSIRSYYVRPNGKGTQVPITEISNQAYGEIQISGLYPATKRFPKHSIFSDKIRFLPRDLGNAEMDYFKTPTAPVWGYTIVLNALVYDASTSTDFEWSEYSTNKVAAIYLSMIGINLKDGELAQFAQMFKAENN